jgi:flagellar hook-basal body complex protein FliE
MNPTSAAGAYSAVAQLANQAQPAANPLAEKGGGADFGAMLESVATSFTGQGRAVEAGAVAMAEGRADVVDLVTAVAETEVALETIVAVRDRVIAAYEEIMRMPI